MKTDTPIPFEAFMRHALHDPQRGYYARRIPGVGARGDFTTAPMLSDAPARAIAAWAARAMRETGCHNLIEIGPGEGRLAAEVWKHLPWSLRWRVSLHLVETSAPLREAQQKLLGRKALWHEHPSEALAACNGKAVIFSNELVDAFPVRRFCKTDAGWQEMAVAISASGQVEESLLPPAPLPDSSAFSRAPSTYPTGQVVEVHESYQRWQQEWLPAWKQGRSLTIDYGSTVERLYHRRPRGTLRAYLMQQRLEGYDIYQNIGRQDLTADINFTDLMHWSSPMMEGQKLLSFREFLTNHHSVSSPGWMDEGGVGEAFLVLDEKRRAR